MCTLSLGKKNHEGAYQRVVGIVRRLRDQDGVIAPPLRKVVIANIAHNLSPGQYFGRNIMLKIS